MIRTRQEKDILGYRDLFEAGYKDKGKAELAMKAHAEFFREVDEVLIASDSKREKLVKRDITNAVLGLTPPFLPAKELTELMLVFKKDSELAEYIDNEMVEIENRYEQYLENIRSWKSWWEHP